MTRRIRWPAVPPRGLRPHLSADQVRDLSLVHYVNLDAIATGSADCEVLYQAIGGLLTWSRAADLLQRGVDEMVEQMQNIERVVERFKRTGHVGFSGEEYQLAKKGIVVMEELARIVDRPTAIAAAEWSERRLDALQAERIAA